MKDFFKKYKVVILLIILLLLKGATYYSKDIVYFLKVQRYNYYVDDFTRIKPTKAVEITNKNENQFLIYFGRDNCPSCLNLIKNIKVISENASKENLPFYYIDEKSNLSIEDISLIDDVFKVEYIPCIVSIKKDQIKIFDYEKLGSENFRNEFMEFLKEDEGG